MLLVGWVGCPHCDFRWRVCVEADGPGLGPPVIVICPNDNSTHRCSTICFAPVAERPAGVEMWSPAGAGANAAPEVPDRRPWWRFW
jgi:hypothetical protein